MRLAGGSQRACSFERLHTCSWHLNSHVRNTMQLAGRVADSNGVPTPCVSVGLATSEFTLRSKQTGWTRTSVGYHGDDGLLYHGNGRGLLRYGPPFGEGDVVGCGVHLKVSSAPLHARTAAAERLVSP